MALQWVAEALFFFYQLVSNTVGVCQMGVDPSQLCNSLNASHTALVLSGLLYYVKIGRTGVFLGLAPPL